MRYRWMAIGVISLLMLAMTAGACSDRQRPPAELDKYLVVPDGIMEWFMDPALRYVGQHDRTYVGFYTSDGEVGILYWDEYAKTLSDAVTVWSEWGYDYKGEQIGDDHASPSVTVLQHQTGDNAIHNGKVLMAAAEHGSATVGKGRLETRRSANAEDISSWETAVGLRTHSSTYALLAELADGTVWLFSRVRDPEDTGVHIWYSYTSMDAGSTWGSGREFFRSEFRASNYIMLDTSADHSELHLILNRAKYTDPGPGFSRYRDIFYIYRDSGGDWRTADGTAKNLPLDFSDGDHTPDLVYQSDASEGQEDWTWLWDIRVDGGGNPFLMSVNQPDMGSWDRLTPGIETRPGYALRHHFDGAQWVTETVCPIGIFADGYKYPAGAVLDPTNMDRVYAMVPDAYYRTQLQVWERLNGSWTETQDITQDLAGWNIRPMAVKNGTGKLRILWSYVDRYDHYMGGAWDSILLAWPGEASGN